MGIAIIPAASGGSLPAGANALVFSGYSSRGDLTATQSWAAGRYIVTVQSEQSVPVRIDTVSNGSFTGYANTPMVISLTTTDTVLTMYTGRSLINSSTNEFSQNSSFSWVYGYNPSSNHWYMTGYFPSGAQTAHYYSTDGGVNWTGTGSKPTISSAGFSVNSNQPLIQNGYTCTVTQTGSTFWFTSNGVTWTNPGSVPDNQNINSMWTGSLFILYKRDTANGNIWTSPTGATWTQRTTNFVTGGFLRSLAQGNGIFLLTGGVSANNNPAAITSTDGITWTQRTVPTGPAGSLYTVFVNGYFLCWNNSPAGAKVTTDGVTWTTVTLPDYDVRPDAVWTQNSAINYRVGNGTVYSSTNGTTWTAKRYGIAYGSNNAGQILVNNVLSGGLVEDTSKSYLSSTRGITSLMGVTGNSNARNMYVVYQAPAAFSVYSSDSINAIN